MMNKPFVSLRPEITRSHALLLMEWLQDDRVTQYLSDSSDVSCLIGQALDRSSLPILTPLFNQGGRFFMVHDRQDAPVGFVRLVKTGADCEIVLVIGDHANWGRSLGASAIREGLKIAFLDMRAKQVLAKIHPENARSTQAFVRSGFQRIRQTPGLDVLTLSAGRYLRLLREGLLTCADIFVTAHDKQRLELLIALEEGPAIVDLEHELERAKVVVPQAVASDVVTMNSQLILRLADEKHAISLVYPEDADRHIGKLSVLSDLGAAILGYSEGSEIDWLVADRPQRIHIEKLTYQPEAMGDFHL
jgi:regulator of nucleoside diphosphate kinase